MKSPSRLTPLQFIEDMVKWQADSLNIFKACLKCGSEPAFQKVYISLHAAELEQCAGPGTVVILGVPFCPNCEDAPAAGGCLHIPFESAIERVALPQIALPVDAT